MKVSDLLWLSLIIEDTRVNYRKIFNIWGKLYVVWCNIYRKKQQTPKNIIDGQFSDVQHLLKNGQKSDSFSAHYRKRHKYTTSETDTSKFIMLEVVNQLNMNDTLKTFTKLKYSPCIK